MKQKLILIIMVCTIFLVGCSSKSDNNIAEEGKKLLDKHDYKQAMKILSSALEEDDNDEYARSMYIQAMRMLKVTRYEEDGNYEKALEELEIIEKIKNGSSEIRNQVINRKAELQKINEEAKKAQLERKEKAKYIASQSKSKIESDAYKEILKDKIRLEKSQQEENKEENKEESNDFNNQNQNNQQPNITPPQPEVSE